jgi:hypothetical protein
MSFFFLDHLVDLIFPSPEDAGFGDRSTLRICCLDEDAP